MKTPNSAFLEGTYYPFIRGGGTFTWTHKGFQIRIPQADGASGSVEVIRPFGTSFVIRKICRYQTALVESKRNAINKALKWIEEQ